MTSENPNDPGEHPDKSVNPKNDSSKKDQHARIKPPVSPKVIPAPKNRNEPCQCRYEPTPRWWRIVEGVGVAAVVFYAVVTYFMWRDSHHNFVIDERAWLTFPTFTKSDVEDLQSGRTFGIIYGRGRYVDIFGETHWYQVCNWHSYYGGTQSHNSTPCVAYSNTGDGDGPFQ